MNRSLTYTERSGWPPLAWVAHVPKRGGPASVGHGSSVETRPDWFGDVVWDGPLSQGGFDESDIVFGSGGRLRGDTIVFVSSVAMVDRLQWFDDGDSVWVSNSLVALLTAIGGTVAPLYRHYPRDFETVTRGIDGYKQGLESSRGWIRLTYFRNLRLEPNAPPAEETKQRRDHALSSYESYRSFLERAIRRLTENAADHSRRAPLSLLGTVSTGFDSPTGAVLARPAGLTEAFTITTARGGQADSGEEIGRRLGLEVHPIPREAWRSGRFPEVPFLASDAKGEDVYFSGAGRLLSRRLVLTGFGATTVWGRSDAPNVELRRSDQSGLSLTEFRLHAGFVHLPVPAIGAVYHDRIFAMQNAADMAAWFRGGPQDKPFARRVLVEAGIPEHLFGQGFKAASVLFFDRRSFLTPTSQADFEAFLRRARTEEKGRAALHAAADVSPGVAASAARTVRWGSALVNRAVPGRLLERVVESERVGRLADFVPGFRYLFPWAVERAASVYDEAVDSSGPR